MEKKNFNRRSLKKGGEKCGTVHRCQNQSIKKRRTAFLLSANHSFMLPFAVGQGPVPPSHGAYPKPRGNFNPSNTQSAQHTRHPYVYKRKHLFPSAPS